MVIMIFVVLINFLCIVFMEVVCKVWVNNLNVIISVYSYCVFFIKCCNFESCCVVVFVGVVK